MQPDTLAILTPLSGIILGIGAGIVAIVTQHRQRLQRAELRHRERLAAIERGIELPPESDLAEIRRPRYLLRGLLWTFGGVAAFLALRAVVGGDESMLGLIPAAIGVAYLVFYFVQGRREEQQEAAARSGQLPSA